MAYDVQHGIVLDLSGRGVRDICSGRIQIPVTESHWDKWATHGNLLGYWELLDIGFRKISPSQKTFIVQKAEETMVRDSANVPWPLCKYVHDSSIREEPAENGGRCRGVQKRYKRATIGMYSIILRRYVQGD